MIDKNLIIAINGDGRTEMTDVEAITLLARATWTLLAEPGDVEASQLIAEHGPARALDLLRSGQLEGRAAARWASRDSEKRVTEMLEAAAASGQRLIIPESQDWPISLRHLGTREPYALWVRGDINVLRRTIVSVIGSRAATGYGVHLTQELVSGFAGEDVSIMSSGAFGIGAEAHRSAIALNLPTICVQASGLDRPYPSAHDSLMHKIADTGLLVSELPPGTSPTRWRFLQRARLLAALSATIVIVEAGPRSGALSVAHEANDLGAGIAVCAVPGPVTSAQSAGCHTLIQAGIAQLVTGTTDLRRLALLNAEPEEN